MQKTLAALLLCVMGLVACGTTAAADKSPREADRDDAPDTVVVCPDVLLPAMRDWVEYRTAQGHTIQFVSAALSAEEVRDAIREAAKPGKLRHVLLVGDADPRLAHSDDIRARSLPTFHAKAKVNVNWGSEPELASDNFYADLDDDSIPDLAVGRLTADTRDELKVMVDKILAYERAGDHGAWRRRINVVAGMGGFGPIIDPLIESAARKFITDDVPSPYELSMTYGSWRSPYCPDPRLFRETALDRMNEGCLFWVYVGHGQRTFLDRLRVPGGAYRGLDVRDVRHVKSAAGSPIAIMLCCYSGAFDAEDDCLAEEMLRTPGGPVAVYSGSRVTMPYAMALMSHEIMRQYFGHKKETLGEVLLEAKRALAADDSRDYYRRLLDPMARLLSGGKHDLADERAEHLLLFNLLGDPLLRMKYPGAVEVTAAREATPGSRIEVSGHCDSPGRLTLELVCRRDMLRFVPPLRDKFDPSDEALTAFTEHYERANDPCWTRQEYDFSGGSFRAELEIPAEAIGPCHVRVFVCSDDSCALGSTDVLVRRATAQSPQKAEPAETEASPFAP